MNIRLPKIRNCGRMELRDVPRFSTEEYREKIIKAVYSGARVVSVFAVPSAGSVTVFCILSDDRAGFFHILSCDMENSYRSITPDCPQMHLFERELAEQWGILPEGHPWLKPVRYQASRRDMPDIWLRNGDIKPAVTSFFKAEGLEVHEVSVGPVHAGVIEPGHFRFQCVGENVMHLEITLGFQHRGVEAALTGGPDKKTLHIVEAAAGDTTAGHSVCYSQLMESLSGVTPGENIYAMRAVLMELERIANHTGDLGAMAGDVGFLPTSSFCGRLRGEYLNMTALLCGSRFGRTSIVPGGSGLVWDKAIIRELSSRLSTSFRDTANAVELMFDAPSVTARFEDTGVISAEDCRALGLVGVPARACGVPLDIRRDFPTGAYRHNIYNPAVSKWGDVFARAQVKWQEIQTSVTFIQELLPSMPALEKINVPELDLVPDSISVSVVEGWRGEIIHCAVTDSSGRFSAYKIVDPSFKNWTGLAMALRDTQISDFPLCNKSFNLSYCGHDL